MDNLWIWLVVKQTPLKKMGLSIGMMIILNSNWKIKVMFQTTNQCKLVARKNNRDPGHLVSTFLMSLEFLRVGLIIRCQHWIHTQMYYFILFPAIFPATPHFSTLG